MDQWNENILWQVNHLARKDAWHQKLVNRLERAEENYLIIKNKLSDQEQFALDEYISLCEEMEYRRAQLAYEVGLRARER